MMRGEVVWLHCLNPPIMMVRRQISWNSLISNLTTLLISLSRFLFQHCISNLFSAYINGSGATRLQQVGGTGTGTGTNLVEMETTSCSTSLLLHNNNSNNNEEIKQVEVEVDEDRLSHLPDDVINLILSLLPTKDAVATTTLSTHWRYKWKNVARLAFNDSSIPLHPEDEAKDDKLVKAISNVLRYHNGPLNTFILYQEKFPTPVPAVTNWINTYLSMASSLTNLEICISSGGPYKIPSNLFNCRNLVRLFLWNCEIEEFPSTFTGFKVLKSLWLDSIIRPSSGRGAAIDIMISSCPLLENLMLMNIEGIGCYLNICAPRLCYLFLESDEVEHVSFRSDCLVEEIHLRLWKGKEAQAVSHHNNNNLCKFFHPIKNSAKVFWCTGYLLRNLSMFGPEPDRLSGGPFLHLTLLLMEDIESNREVLAFVCILRSCPNLKYLTILQFTGGEFEFWEDDIRRRRSTITPCPLPQLKRLSVLFTLGSKGEFDLIQFLVSNTPSLQSLSILAPTWVASSEFFKESIKSASPQAEVSVIEFPQGQITVNIGEHGIISWMSCE